MQFELSPFSGFSLEIILRLSPSPILYLAIHNKGSWQALHKVNFNIFRNHGLNPALMFSFWQWTFTAQSDIWNHSIHPVWSCNAWANQRFCCCPDNTTSLCNIFISPGITAQLQTFGSVLWELTALGWWLLIRSINAFVCTVFVQACYFAIS